MPCRTYSCKDFMFFFKSVINVQWLRAKITQKNEKHRKKAVKVICLKNHRATLKNARQFISTLSGKKKLEEDSRCCIDLA